jgi:tight adherence protein B
MTLVISILVFSCVVLFFVSLRFIYQDVRDFRTARLVSEIRGRAGMPETGRTKEDGRWRGLSLPFRPAGLASVRYLIESSHLRLSPERFLLISCLAGLICMAVSCALSLGFFLSLCSAAGGFFLPFLVLKIKTSRYEQVLIRQFPEAVESIARGLRAGQSVDTAIREIGRNFPAPMGTEFRTLHDEMVMGLSFETVLENLIRKFPRLPEVRILSVTFLVHRETGGNLVDTIDGLAATIRERLRLKRQVKASTAEGRATAMVLGMMPIAFGGIMWITRPDYMRVFFEHPTGKKLLIAALFMETAGIFFMRLLSRFKT